MSTDEMQSNPAKLPVRMPVLIGVLIMVLSLSYIAFTLVAERRMDDCRYQNPSFENRLVLFGFLSDIFMDKIEDRKIYSMKAAIQEYVDDSGDSELKFGKATTIEDSDELIIQLQRTITRGNNTYGPFLHTEKQTPPSTDDYLPIPSPTGRKFHWNITVKTNDISIVPDMTGRVSIGTAYPVSPEFDPSIAPWEEWMVPFIFPVWTLSISTFSLLATGQFPYMKARNYLLYYIFCTMISVSTCILFFLLLFLHALLCILIIPVLYLCYYVLSKKVMNFPDKSAVTTVSILSTLFNNYIAIYIILTLIYRIIPV